MASYGYTFNSGDGVTPTRLNAARTVSEIVNADVSATAAIAGTKIAPDFGAQNVVTTGNALIGTTTALDVTYGQTSGKLALAGVAQVGIAIGAYSNDQFGSRIDFVKSRNATTNSKTVVQANDGLGNIIWGGTDGTAVIPAVGISGEIDGTPGTNDMPGRLTFLTTADGSSSLAERMRITKDGFVFIGKAQSDTTVSGIEIDPAGVLVSTRASGSAAAFNRQNDNGSVVVFRRANTQVGSVSVTTTATTYNTSSDHRLKESVQPMTGALEKVAEMKPVTFDWKVNGEKGQGFIAHELQAVVPEAVTGAKDAVDAEGKPEYQGVDAAKLVPYLVAAVQELKARVEVLEAA